MCTYLIEQGFNLLLLLPLTDLVRVSHLEELRGDLNEPFWLDGSHVMAVLARRQDQFVVDTPFGVAIEQRGRWVDVHRCAFHKRLVAFLGILLRRVSEVARADCSADAVVVLARRDDVMLVSNTRVELTTCRREGMERRTCP